MRSFHAPRPATSRPLFSALLVAAALAPTALAQTPAAEVKSAANATLMRLNTDAGLVVRGASFVGVIPATGAGTRMMWHPAKAAFRAGDVDAAQWDEANVGLYSVALGYNTTASGGASTAMGGSTTASGNNATAMGNNTTASGTNATAMGTSTTASVSFATAMGLNTTASGLVATAMGSGTTASGEVATAMGVGSKAQAYASVAIGRYNVVTGDLGSWVPTDPLLVGGDGTGDASRSNSFVIFKNGAAQFQGTVTASVASPSDARLKEDVAPVGSVLARVLALRPVTYRYRAETERSRAVQVGLVAQEVAALFPELVETAPDGYLSVQYGNLAPVAVAAIQEQQAEIAGHRARLGALEAENAALRESDVALRARLGALEALVARLAGTVAAAERPR